MKVHSVEVVTTYFIEMTEDELMEMRSLCRNCLDNLNKGNRIAQVFLNNTAGYV